MASHERIDEINILQATYEAMRQAIGKLDPAPDLTLNDAVTIPGVQEPERVPMTTPSRGVRPIDVSRK